MMNGKEKKSSDIGHNGWVGKGAGGRKQGKRQPKGLVDCLFGRGLLNKGKKPQRGGGNQIRRIKVFRENRRGKNN